MNDELLYVVALALAKYRVKTSTIGADRLVLEADKFKQELHGMGFTFEGVPSDVMVKLLEVLAE